MPNWCNNYITIKGDKNKINLINDQSRNLTTITYSLTWLDQKKE